MPNLILNKDETEKLIEMVRQDPCIYDPREQNHKDSAYSANFWASVARGFDKPGFEGMYSFASRDLKCIII